MPQLVEEMEASIRRLEWRLKTEEEAREEAQAAAKRAAAAEAAGAEATEARAAATEAEREAEESKTALRALQADFASTVAKLKSGGWW